MRKILSKLIGSKESTSGWYARFPVFVGEDIFFVAGNDLFKIAKGSLSPELYFQSTGDLSHLCAHETKIACVCDEDGGPDIYLFDTKTRLLERLTYFEKEIRIVEFKEDAIYFASNKGSAFFQDCFLYKYDFKTNQVEDLGIGPINWYARVGKSEKYDDLIMQRYGYGYINWKAYKGGRAGSLWRGDKKFIDLPGNCLRPFMVSNRVFFLYDDGKNGNIFSCDKNGKELKQHTKHTDFQVQDLYHSNEINNGKLLYSKNGQIGVYDVALNKDTLLQLEGYMPHPDSRAFIPHPQKYVTSVATDGSNLMLAIRGNVFTCGIWSGGMKKLNDELRHRVAGILHDKRVYSFKEPPESVLCIYEGEKEVSRFKIDCGKIAFTKAPTKGDLIAYVNHRHELHLVNTKTGKDEIIFKADHRLHFCDWSADADYLVYSASGHVYQSKIVVYDVEKKKNHDVTCGRYRDTSPTFDPSGKYIAFLSNRAVGCVYDGLKFDWAFDQNTKPYIVSLQKNQNLLMPWKDSIKEDDEEEKPKKKAKKEKLVIDFEGINERIVALPVKERVYDELFAVSNSRLVMTSSCVQNDDDDEEDVCSNMIVEIFNFKNLSSEIVYKNLSYFDIGAHREYCVIEEDDKIKVLKVGEKPEETGYKKGGAFDWNRYKYQLDPRAEWKQMAYELWYLMCEFFWSPQLSGLNWEAIWKQYKPYLDNIRTKQELYDIMSEIQGELGTSHAFILEKGLDNFRNHRGYLGADIEYDARMKAHKIKRIFKANLEVDVVSPFLAANANIQEGECIFEIDGVELNAKNSVDELLANKANTWVTLQIGKDKKTSRIIEIKTIVSDAMLRYKAWVDGNREYVEKASNGKIGYIHVSDMQKRGFKEFYQSYLCEYNKQAIILDVRYNRGGNISCLLLDQLSRKRLGVDMTRWHGQNELPSEASRGAYVLIVNAHTASDGEMFSHQFKMLGLGKVVGERTWGGVVGIMPRYRLIDGTLTSQPEFATWFADNEYSLENTGVIPDFDIANSLIAGKEDAQLKKSVELALQTESVDYSDRIKRTKHPKR